MGTPEIDDELQAIEALIKALTPLDREARERVLEYTFKRLDLTRATPEIRPSAVVEARPPSDSSPKPLASVSDIRSLRAQKQPRSANEMAALVAYYLSELAPESERRDVVSTADIEKYFKQAGHQLPRVPAQTLKNAAAAGYFDSAGRGAYKLNPVGYNLVAHNLPRAETTSPATSRRRASRSPKTGGKPRKASTRKSTKKSSAS
jgi:hypothetical protein